MHFHGLADKTVPFTGVPKFGDLKVDGPPVTDVMAFWRRVDSCPPPTITKNGVLTISGSKCPDNREVVLVTLDDLGHDWPSQATSALWRFFAAHPG
jgi:polyhydroxybutyrate depolymerase